MPMRIALLIALVQAGRSGAQIVFQETFDTGVLSPGWVWQSNAPVLVTPDASGGGYCAGKESLNDVPPPPGEIGSFMFHDLPYAPGAMYQASLHMRVETTSGIIPGAACWIGWWSAATVEEATSVFTQSASWEFLESGYATPAAHQPTPTLRFGIGLIVAQSAVDAMAYFDNIEVDAINFTMPAPVRLNLKAWLEGPFNAAQNLMRDDLRVAGLLPVVDPYGSGATIAPSVLSVAGNDAVVDWVQVELRIHPTNPLAVASASGLIQRDGDIVATDGSSPLAFIAAPGTYRVVVKHRNHLAIMGSTAYAITATPVGLDYRVATTPMHVRPAPNNDLPRKTIGSWAVMWAGNVHDDDRLRYVGANNDRDPILQTIGGSTPSATITGYHAADVNLDGVVKYVGNNNDRDPILVNIGGSTPTAVRVEQVP